MSDTYWALKMSICFVRADSPRGFREIRGKLKLNWFVFCFSLTRKSLHLMWKSIGTIAFDILDYNIIMEQYLALYTLSSCVTSFIVIMHHHTSSSMIMHHISNIVHNTSSFISIHHSYSSCSIFLWKWSWFFWLNTAKETSQIRSKLLLLVILPFWDFRRFVLIKTFRD